MNDDSPEVLFQALLAEFTLTQGAGKGNWFSLPAMQIEGKIFAALWLNGDIIIKLPQPQHQEALALKGAVLFKPMPDRNPMKEWVQIPPAHRHLWHDLSLAGLAYVQAQARKKPKKQTSDED